MAALRWRMQRQRGYDAAHGQRQTPPPALDVLP